MAIIRAVMAWIALNVGVMFLCHDFPIVAK
jgi:hypothetical protein